MFSRLLNFCPIITQSSIRLTIPVAFIYQNSFLLLAERCLVFGKPANLSKGSAGRFFSARTDEWDNCFETATRGDFYVSFDEFFTYGSSWYKYICPSLEKQTARAYNEFCCTKPPLWPKRKTKTILKGVLLGKREYIQMNQITKALKKVAAAYNGVSLILRIAVGLVIGAILALMPAPARCPVRCGCRAIPARCPECRWPRRSRKRAW